MRNVAAFRLKHNERCLAQQKDAQHGPKELPPPAALPSISHLSSAQIVSLFSLQDHAAKEKALQSLTPAQISSLHNMQNKAGGGGGGGAGGAGLAHHVAAAHAGLHHPHHGHQLNHTSHVATAAAGLAALGIAPPPSVTPHFNWQPALAARDADVKPSGLSLTTTPASLANSHNNNNNDWEGRCIASQKLRLLEFTAFLDSGPDSDRHLFVQIGGVNACYTDPLLEDIDLRQISDKFPASKGGLKDLYDKGPQDAFFLVKFWADLNIPNSLIDDPRSFYGVASHFESVDRMSLCLSTKVCSFGKEAVEKVEVSALWRESLTVSVETDSVPCSADD